MNNPMLQLRPTTSTSAAPVPAQAFSISAYKPLPPEKFLQLEAMSMEVSGGTHHIGQHNDWRQNGNLSIPENRAPSRAMRQELVARQHILRQFISTPASPSFIAEKLGEMFLEHGMKFSKEELAIRVAKIYMPKIGQLNRPTLEYCFSKSYENMPKPFHLLEAAKEFAAPWGFELHMIHRVLKARIEKVWTQEEKEVAAERAKELAAMVAKIPAEQALKAAEVKRKRQEAYANSPEMLETKAKFCDELGRIKVGPSLQQWLDRMAAEIAAETEAEATVKVIADLPDRQTTVDQNPA